MLSFNSSKYYLHFYRLGNWQSKKWSACLEPDPSCPPHQLESALFGGLILLSAIPHYRGWKRNTTQPILFDRLGSGCDSGPPHLMLYYTDWGTELIPKGEKSAQCTLAAGVSHSHSMIVLEPADALSHFSGSDFLTTEELQPPWDPDPQSGFGCYS